jgi:hypothetical protein
VLDYGEDFRTVLGISSSVEMIFDGFLSCSRSFTTYSTAVLKYFVPKCFLMILSFYFIFLTPLTTIIFLDL